MFPTPARSPWSRWMRAAALIAPALVGAAILAGCAPYPPAPPSYAAAAGGERRCFMSDDVTGFRDRPQGVVDVIVSRRQVYRLDLYGPCPGIESATGVTVLTRRGKSWVCEGADVDVILPRAAFAPQLCPAHSLRLLSEREKERVARP